MCQVLEISRASFYKWLNRKVPLQELENKELIKNIVDIYNKYEGIYGYRRIYIYIRLKLQKKVNHKRIYRLMKLIGLQAVIRRKRKKYIKSTPSCVAKNILNRKFNETIPNKKWVTDVTEFKLKNGNKVYLSSIYDLGSKKIISHEINTSNNNDFVFKTIKKAMRGRNTKGILLHSDRGYQYTSPSFKALLIEKGMIQSMSRVGKCIDNGPMENVWGIMKSELFKGSKKQRFENIKTAKLSINKYINFFNEDRITLKMAALIS